MKKKLLFLGVATLALATSCNTKENYSSNSFNVGTINVITDLSEGTAHASFGYYLFQLTTNETGQTGTISTSDLILNNQATSFTTESQSYKNIAFSGFITDAYLSNVQTANGSLSNANFLLTPFFYVPNSNTVTSFPNDGNKVIAQYNYNNRYLVKTFPEYSFYVGTTLSTYTDRQGTTETANKEDIYYMLVLGNSDKVNPDKENINLNTATLYIFNAVFSNNPNEPPKSKITLSNLSVDYSGGKIKVSGTDVIPLVGMGNSEVEYPNYIFKTITFETLSYDLTQCGINFVVGEDGNYKASFSGSYTSYNYSSN